MALSYPLSLPSTEFVNLQFSQLNANAQAQNPASFQSQLQSYSGHMWGLQVDYRPMERADAAAVIAFLAGLYGKEGYFLAGDPVLSAPLGVASGAPKVNGSSQVGRTLATKGWPPSVTNIMRAGDSFQIGQRLYMVLQDANSNGSGQASLEIWPPVGEVSARAVADNDVLITSSPKGLFRLNSDVVDLYSVDIVRHFGMSFQAIEYL